MKFIKMKNLSEAIEFAKHAHEGQTDRSGKPYIEHPLAVMALTNLFESSEISYLVRMAAVLHDVVEDCKVSLPDLRAQNFPESVVIAVDHLSRRETESYWSYLDRLCKNKIARIVKMADLMHNSDLNRLYATGDIEFTSIASRYARAYFLVKQAHEAKKGESHD
jgi:(p)ppGpp synthase/HD superfamily hydrolase